MSQNHDEYQYLELIKHTLATGNHKPDRTGTGVTSIFGYQMRYNLENGFPLLTTKKLHLKSIIHELLWFLNGETNIKYLTDNNVKIWNEWANEEGDLGPVYGSQWRSWKGANGETIDQISLLIEEIKNNPNSRRLLVTAWNPAVLPDPKIAPELNPALGRQALPPCHCLFQFYVHDGKISCQLYQRSADIFLGVPFNIASYALLLMMIAKVCNLVPHEFIHVIGDGHIYNNHFEQVKEQITRTPYPFPKMEIARDVKDIFDFKFEDFVLTDYESHPHIKGAISK